MHPEILCKHEDQPLMKTLEVFMGVTSSSSEAAVETRRKNNPPPEELQDACRAFRYFVHHLSRNSTMNLLKEEYVPFMPQDDLFDSGRITSKYEDMHEERPTSASDDSNRIVSIGNDLLTSVTDVKMVSDGHIEQILNAKMNTFEESTFGKSLPSGGPSEGSHEEQTTSAAEAKNAFVYLAQALLTSDCMLNKSPPSGSPSENIQEEQTASTSEGTNASSSISKAVLPSVADDMRVAQSKEEKASHATQTYEDSAALSATVNIIPQLNERIADVRLNSTSKPGSLYDKQTATADPKEKNLQRFCDERQDFRPESFGHEVSPILNETKSGAEEVLSSQEIFPREDISLVNGELRRVLRNELKSYNLLDCFEDKLSQHKTSSASKWTNAKKSKSFSFSDKLVDGKKAAIYYNNGSHYRVIFPEDPISFEKNKTTRIVKESVINEIEAKETSGWAYSVWAEEEKQELQQKIKTLPERHLTKREWKKISKSVSAVKSVHRSVKACQNMNLRLRKDQKNKEKKEKRLLKRLKINNDVVNTIEKKPSAVSFNCKEKVGANSDTGNPGQKPKTIQFRDTRMEMRKYPAWSQLEKDKLVEERAKYPQKKITKENWEVIAKAVSCVQSVKRGIKTCKNMHSNLKKEEKNRSNKSKKRIRNTNGSMRSGSGKKHKSSNDGASSLDADFPYALGGSSATGSSSVKSVDASPSTTAPSFLSTVWNTAVNKLKDAFRG